MADAEPTLLLTRPEAQSKAFLNMCETRLGRRIPVVVSPLMRIEPVGDVPNLSGFGTVVATSGNGIDRLGSALAGRTVRSVGEKTAEKARCFGAEARALGENVEAFLAKAGALEGPVLVVRGVHARGDLAEHLRDAGSVVEEAVLYDQVAVPLSQAAMTLLAGEGPVIAPVFSPRSANLLAKHRGHAPLRVLAISSDTAAAWDGSDEVLIAARPDAEAMCDLVAEAF